MKKGLETLDNASITEKLEKKLKQRKLFKIFGIVGGVIILGLIIFLIKTIVIPATNFELGDNILGAVSSSDGNNLLIALKDIDAASEVTLIIGDGTEHTYECGGSSEFLFPSSISWIEKLGRLQEDYNCYIDVKDIDGLNNFNDVVEIKVKGEEDDGDGGEEGDGEAGGEDENNKTINKTIVNTGGGGGGGGTTTTTSSDCIPISNRVTCSGIYCGITNNNCGDAVNCTEVSGLFGEGLNCSNGIWINESKNCTDYIDNYWIKDYAHNGSLFEDVCLDSNNLTEFLCECSGECLGDEIAVSNVTVECLDGCSDGKCLCVDECLEVGVNFCDINVPYNCSLNETSGCNERINNSECGIGFECVGGSGCVEETGICEDNDGDGYGVCPNCGIINGCDFDEDDCNDSIGGESINHGMIEDCDNDVDDDCDGDVDGDDSDCGGENCYLSSSSDWQNFFLTPQYNLFTVEFDATPNNPNIDALITLSNQSVNGYDQSAVLVKFNPSGFIDIRNNDTYDYDLPIYYSVNTQYHFKIDVDVPNHRYDVFVDDVLIAENYLFRYELRDINEISYWGITPSGDGNINVCDFAITSSTPLLDCSLTSASWSAEEVNEGTEVELIVEGTDCSGKEMNFTIYEDDLIWDPEIISIESDFDRTSWTTIYEFDWGTPNEYYFEVFEVGNESNKVTSDNPMLRVNNVVEPLTGNNLTQSNITWTFDKPVTLDGADGSYQYGTFVNGDYWIVNPDGGDVTIIDIDPEPIQEITEVSVNDKVYRCRLDHISNSTLSRPETGTEWQENWTYIGDLESGEEAQNGEWNKSRAYYGAPGIYMHGTMINIDEGISMYCTTMGGSATFNQGIDERGCGFNWDLYKIPPYSVGPNSSILSTKSIRPGEYYEQGYEKGVPESRMRSAAVLTVLDNPPEYLSFRPAYLGKDKKLLYVKDMDLSVLPELDIISSTPEYDMSIFYYRTVELWKNYIPRVPGSTCISRAADNFPAGGYDNGPLAQNLHNIVALMLMNETQLINDKDYPLNWKENLSMYLIQYGVDMYGARLANFSSGYVGGQIGHGDKWPILFAGLVLDDERMKKTGETLGASDDPRKHHLYFMEDAQIFYVNQTDIDYWSDDKYIATRGNSRVDSGDPTIIIDDDGTDWSISDDGTIIPARSSGTNFDYWLIWDYGSGNEEYVRIIGVNATGTGLDKMELRTPVTPGSGKIARVQLFPQGRLGLPDWGERHPCNPAGDYWSRAYRYSTGEELVGPQLAALAILIQDKTETGRSIWKWNPYFDYVDMFMTDEGIVDKARHTPTSFVADLWDTYRSQFGCIYEDYLSYEGVRVYNCSGELVDCSEVIECLDYPNDRACNYDPCGVGGDEGCGEGETLINNNLTQFGITWFFDKPVINDSEDEGVRDGSKYLYGTFANGDYWVKTNDVTGVVNTISVDPIWDGTKNGAMIDPVPGVSTQGYDVRLTDYHYPYNETIRVKFPIEISANKSLISVKGVYFYAYVDGDKSAINSSAVLTIVDNIYPDTTFRPAFVFGEKVFYDTRDVDYNLLPNLPVPTNIDIPNLTENMKMPWIYHGPKTFGEENIFPISDIGNSYPPRQTRIVSRISIEMLFNIPDKVDYVNRLIQLGIDNYPIASRNDYAWMAAGGYGSGHKWPILFAGIMLDEESLKDLPIFTQTYPLAHKFAEDGYVYYNSNSEIMFGSEECSSGQTTWPQCTSNCMCRDPDGLLYPEEMNNGGTYRSSVSPSWVGEVLAMIILDSQTRSKDLWDYPEIFDYVDHWINNPANWSILNDDSDYKNDIYGYGGDGGGFMTYVWETYRGDYGCAYESMNTVAHTRIYNCSNELIDCNDVSDCSNYSGNDRACDYDPCGLGCGGVCEAVVENTYYLDANLGDDTWDGLASIWDGVHGPWETIEHAEATADPGSRIKLKDGNYGEVSIISDIDRNSWDEGLLFEPYNDAKPIFDKLEITGNYDRYLIFNGINVIAPTDSCYYGTWDGLVHIESSNHIKIINSNITGRFATNCLNGYSDCCITFWGVMIYNSRTQTLMSDITIENNDISDTYRGLRVITEDNLGEEGSDYSGMVIKDNEIHHQAATSLWVNVVSPAKVLDEILVEGNHIYGREKIIEGSDGSHGSGILIGSNNVTLRGNTVRSSGGSNAMAFWGPTTMPVGGYHNILIENNLVYDSATRNNHLVMEGLTDNIIIINNTFIGRQAYVAPTTNEEKYGSVIKLEPYTSSGATNIFLYDNICVGALDLDSNLGPITEDNNIFWSIKDAGVYLDSPYGDTTKLLHTSAALNPEYTQDYFETSGLFFDGGDLFDQYAYSWSTDLTDVEIFYDIAYSANGVNLGDSFRPVIGSDACSDGIITKGHLAGETCGSEPSENVYVSATGLNGDGSFANPFSLDEAIISSTGMLDVELTYLLEAGDYGDMVLDSKRDALVTWKGNDDNVIFNSLILNSAENYKFENIIIQNPEYVFDDGSRGIWIIDSDSLIFDNIKMNSGYRKAIEGDNSTNVQVINSEIQNSEIAIIASGDNWYVYNNSLHDLTSDGILVVDLENSLIKENEIYDLIAVPTSIYHVDGIQFYNSESGGAQRRVIHNITLDSNIIRDVVGLIYNSSGDLNEHGHGIVANDYNDTNDQHYAPYDIKFIRNLIYNINSNTTMIIDDPINISFIENTFLGTSSIRNPDPDPFVDIFIVEVKNNIFERAAINRGEYVTLEDSVDNLCWSWTDAVAPDSFSEEGVWNNVTDFRRIIFVDYPNDLTPLSDGPACSGGVVTHGHLTGQACGGALSSLSLFARIVDWVQELFSLDF